MAKTWTFDVLAIAAACALVGAAVVGVIVGG